MYLGENQKLTIAAKSFALSAAPPTSAPSTFGFSMSPAIVAGFTLPPYWMRTPSAAAAPYFASMVLRMCAQTSYA